MKDNFYNSEWIVDPRFPGNKIHSTAIIGDNVKMGKGNIIYPYSVIGMKGFIRDSYEWEGSVVIGDNNQIGCYTSIMTGKSGVTMIGSDNMLMNYVNVGHNTKLGNDCEIGASTVIAGWVNIESEVQIKTACIIRNRVNIGKGAMIGQGSNVVKDVARFEYTYGNPAKKRNICD